MSQKAMDKRKHTSRQLILGKLAIQFFSDLLCHNVYKSNVGNHTNVVFELLQKLLAVV